MLRLLLSLLLLFSGALIGLHYSRRLTRRRDILLGFEMMLRRASIGISYDAGDLCEVFGDNFADFSFEHGVPFDQQWEALVNGFSYFLHKEDTALLLDFAKGLGASDTASQQRHIALYLSRLEEQIVSAQDEIGTKGKMYRIIPLSAGMILAILTI